MNYEGCLVRGNVCADEHSELCHGDDLDPKFFEMVRKNGDYLARQIRANPDIFKKVRKWFWPYATVE